MTLGLTVRRFIEQPLWLWLFLQNLEAVSLQIFSERKDNVYIYLHKWTIHGMEAIQNHLSIRIKFDTFILKQN